ncbi:MAG: winged helix-turn-helix transcriptional regulator [Lachnospiraceae bacterium]|nr:winged helix-turn-helix transcriptional regulator [Lachnospiraceae bacterium]
MKEKKIFMYMMETQALHHNESRKGFQRLDLSDGIPKILYTLRGHEGCVQKDLAEMCSIKPSTATVILEKMEREGLIVKEMTRVSGGKCAKCIFLTEKGWEKARAIEKLVDDLEEKCFEGFSEEEREMLFTLLKRVQKNLASLSED